MNNRIAIMISRDVLNSLKVRAAKEQKSMRSIVEALIKKYIEAGK